MDGSSAASNIAQHLKATVAASHAFQLLGSCSATKLGSKREEGEEDPPAATAQDLLEATSTEAGRRAVVSSLTATPDAVEHLLRIIKVGTRELDSHVSTMLPVSALRPVRSCRSLSACDCSALFVYPKP